MTTADRMAVLDKGVVQQVGAPITLYDDPVNPFVANFVGTMNQLPGQVLSRSGSGLSLDVEGVGALHLPLSAGPTDATQVMLSFRPHALTLQTADAARDAQSIWLPGLIEASEFLGQFTRYRVRVGEHALSVDDPHHTGQSKLAAGTPVSLGLAASQVRLFAA